MKSAIAEYLEVTEIDPELEKLRKLAIAEFERMKEVIKTTRETRAAQKTYYDGGRLQGDLKKAKQWEKELDLRLSRLWTPEPSADATQERLL